MSKKEQNKNPLIERLLKEGGHSSLEEVLVKAMEKLKNKREKSTESDEDRSED